MTAEAHLAPSAFSPFLRAPPECNTHEVCCQEATSPRIPSSCMTMLGSDCLGVDSPGSSPPNARHCAGVTARRNVPGRLKVLAIGTVAVVHRAPFRGDKDEYATTIPTRQGVWAPILA